MFGKKCSRCKKKISKSYDFCPYCGNSLRSKHEKQDYGMLGKNDFFEENDPLLGRRLSFIDRMFNNAMRELPSMIKMIEKQMQEDFIDSIDRRGPHQLPNNLHVQFFINGKKVLPDQDDENEMPEKNLVKKNMPKEKLEKFSKLPKTEPISKVRRLSGKIIYELEVPGVKNIDDVLINQLEDSIEIKALSKDKYYSKTLNINLPIINYKLRKENLILELEAR